MTDNSNNLNTDTEAGNGHEFLPLDFSVNENRTAGKKALSHTPAPMKLPLSSVVKEVPAEPVKPPAPEKVRSLDEVFPDDKDDSPVFSGGKSKSSDAEIAELKKTFEDTPAQEESRRAPKSPAMLRRGFPPVPPKPLVPHPS